MLKVFILFLSMYLFVGLIHGQESVVLEKWSQGTASVMPHGKWESGIIQPFRYGLNDKIEIRSNALLMPVLPNIGIKVSHGHSKGFSWASEHSVSYPTLFLNLVSLEGTGGLISPQFHFPFILSLTNSMIVTKSLAPETYLTADAGVALAIRNYKPSYQATIDLPLLYPRMAHYYEGTSLRAGLSFKSRIIPKFYFEETARLFYITRESDNIFAENSNTIMWVLGKSIRLKGGFVLAWGKYPFGEYVQMWPTLDLVFGGGR